MTQPQDQYVIIREVVESRVYKEGDVRFSSIYYSIFKTRFGWCLVASTEKGICNILFSDGKNKMIKDLKKTWPKVKTIKKSLPAHRQIEIYFKSTALYPKRLKVKLHLHGTDFQFKVWKALLSISTGDVVSYGDVATRLGDKKMSRAVGTAIGNNPIGYIIPCHRVLKSTGEIGGYRWGVKRKKAMLRWEAVKERDSNLTI